jgi:oligoendopeptidase F
MRGGPAEAQRYIDFLKCGSSVYPIDALREAGVDMSSPQPIEEAFAYLDQLVDRLSGLLSEHREVAASAG